MHKAVNTALSLLLRSLRQSLFLGDLQRRVFVALDHRAKIGRRDILNDAAGFFDSGAEFL